MPESDDPRRIAADKATDNAAKPPPKLRLTSMDIAADKRAALKRLFPEVFTEDAIDFECFKQVLGEYVDTAPERFGLTWPGKAACMRVIQQPSVATLKPCRVESVDFDATDNVFIEGDNLEVLKLLQKVYYGQVKMIYIDPPYNTGKEFIYPDKYTETLATYLQYTGQKDSEGRKFASNPDTDGRYHSNWLNMMYPRLYLARNLLRDDGVIFISIDDNECANLKALCDQVFGEENFFADLVVIRAEGGGLAKKVIKGHDNLLVYAKSIECFPGIVKPKDVRGKIVTIDGREFWIEEDWLRKEFGKYGTLLYEDIEAVKGSKKKAEIDQGLEDGRYRLLPKANGHVVGRLRALDEDGTKFYSILKHLNKTGIDALKQLGMENFFDFPKPLSLCKELILGTTLFSKNAGDLILDFFAGAATTAHAVMQVNAEDNGNRRYICVQLPEPCDPQSAAYQAGYQTIAAIGRERLRRAAKQIAAAYNPTDQHKTRTLDLGFKAFQLAASNFKPWQSDANKVYNLEQQLIDHVDHIDATSSQEDILYELLLTLGLPLTTKLDKIQLADKDVFAIGHAESHSDESAPGERKPAELLICLDKNLNQAVIDAMAAQAPQQVICLDQGFNHNDQLKANAVQTFKLRAQQVGREIVFRTV